MSEVIFLGNKKVYSIDDIKGTNYINDLVLLFLNGSLERWLDEETQYKSYSEHLKKIPKEVTETAIEDISNLFDVSEKTKVIDSQNAFSEAINANREQQILLKRGRYVINGNIPKYTMLSVTVMELQETEIIVGYALKKKINEHFNSNISIKYDDFTDEDIIAHIEDIIQEKGLGDFEQKEIKELFENFKGNEKKFNKLRMDFFRRIGELEEALKYVECLSDETGEKEFYYYNIYQELGNDEKDIVNKYLKVSAEKGYVESLVQYIPILKNGTKEDQKEARKLLENNVDKSVSLQILLADFYYRGVGGKRNLDKALEIYVNAERDIPEGSSDKSKIYTGIGDVYIAQKKQDEAMEYYGLSSEPKKVMEVVKYYKKKENIKLVIDFSEQCAGLGYVDALAELSEYLLNQQEEMYKDKSLDIAIDYVRNKEGNSERKKLLLEKQYAYQDKKEKNHSKKTNCERIEKEAADNGIRLSKTRIKVKEGLKKTIVFLGTPTVTAIVTAGVGIGINKIKEKGKGGTA